MYSQEFKEYGFIGSSFVGEAVIFDLINYASKGTQDLDDYNKTMKEVTDKQVKQVQGLEKASPVRRFFARIRNFFVPVKQEEMTYTPEETESINSHLRDYREADNQLWKYNLRDNIVLSIVKKIRQQGEDAYTLPELLEESVIPDLEKLGLADLIPQLQQALIEEYKKDLPDPEIYQVKEEDMHLYVPDFNRTTQNSGEVDLEELSRQAKQAINGAKRTLKQNGVSLSDFALMDKTYL